MIGKLAIFVGLATLILAAPATEAKQVGKGSGTSFATVTGNASKPNKLVAEVRSSPNPHEEVDVQWGVSCLGSDSSGRAATPR